MSCNPCCDGLFLKPYSTVVMLDSGASHSLIAESVVKLHKWFVDNTEPIYIHLDIGSKVVSDSIYYVPIVFCDVGGHVIT